MRKTKLILVSLALAFTVATPIVMTAPEISGYTVEAATAMSRPDSVYGKNLVSGTDGTWIKVASSNLWQFKLKSTGKVATGWQQIDKKYYFFDANGYSSSGWIKGTITVQTEKYDVYYYFNEKTDSNGYKSCEMLTGKQVINGHTFFMNDTAPTAQGKAPWYGTMLADDWRKETTSSGTINWYYHDSNGYMVVNTEKLIKSTESGTDYQGQSFKYYFNSNGIMQTGFVSATGKMYNNDATRAYNKKIRTSGNDKRPLGALITSDWACLSNGVFCYADANGKLVNGNQTINNNLYYFINHEMQVGWFTVGSNKYYGNTSKDNNYKVYGILYRGLNKIGSAWYYFNTNGIMQENGSYVYLGTPSDETGLGKFTDSKFITYLNANFNKTDIDKYKILDNSELHTANQLILVEKGISDLKGIEQLPYVTLLECQQNNLTTLDLSKNTAITNIDCQQNNLTVLDFSKNTKLKSLSCGKNPLTTLTIPAGVTTVNATPEKSGFVFMGWYDANGTKYTDETLANRSSAITVTAKYECVNHSWELGEDGKAGTITKDSTCTEEGSRHFKCKVCGKEQDEVIPKKEHAYEDVAAKEATCTEDGWAAYKKCKDCGAETDHETYGKTGHNYVETITKEATCQETGVLHHECSKCHDKYDTDIAIVAHKYDTLVPKKNVTCTEDGHSAYHICVWCKAEKPDDKIVYEAQGHRYGDWIITKEASCVDGSKYHICEKCSNKETVVIPATGKHVFNGEFVKGTPATCTKDGLSDGHKCSACGQITDQTVIKATGHHEVAIPDVAPTYDKEGSTGGTKCSTCGKILTNPTVVPKLEKKVKNGWVTKNSKWYYYVNNKATTGWKQISKKLYFFNKTGVMQTGWVKSSGKWYFMNKSGVMQTGWIKSGSKWYYMNTDGTMVANKWIKSGRYNYYMKADGSMAANEYCKGYWLNKDGKWTYKAKASWIKTNKGWQYKDTKGWVATNCVLTIDGNRYVFTVSGYLR